MSSYAASPRKKIVWWPVAAVAFVVTIALSALAVPPPLSETEMQRHADLVVRGRSIAIRCMGERTAVRDVRVAWYLSTIATTDIEKGDAKGPLEVVGEKMLPSTAMTGWAVAPPLPSGWSGKLYLKTNPDRTHSAVHYNAYVEDPGSTPGNQPPCPMTPDAPKPAPSPTPRSGCNCTTGAGGADEWPWSVLLAAAALFAPWRGAGRGSRS